MHVITNVCLFMLRLLHQEEQMTLQHGEKLNHMVVGSETLIITFSGVEKDEPMEDAFNFYLSQLRIQIEKTF